MWFFKRKTSPGTVPALFLHIQKTAGTSIVDVARQHYGASISSHGECWSLAIERLKQINFVSGHMGYDFARHLMEGRFSFTFLRDPAERILSMYYFCRSRDPGEYEIYRRAHDLSLDDFLLAGLTDPWIKKSIWNGQAWQLAHGFGHLDQRTISDFREPQLLDLAQAHLSEFSYVGFTETFDLDAQAILSALALPIGASLPVSNPTLGRPSVSQVSPRTKALLDEMTVLDRQLYEFARTRSPSAKLAGARGARGHI